MSATDRWSRPAAPKNPLAESAIAIGAAVFPCDENKYPLTKHGFKDASADPSTIRTMFASPSAVYIGMPTGEPCGCIVVDVDIKDGAQGMDWLNANSHRMPQTYTVKTRSGGLHIYLMDPIDSTIRNSQSKIAPGVDVRATGGYVIVPPSPGYSVADNIAPAPVPDWLLAILCPVPVPMPSPAPRMNRKPTLQGGSAYGLSALEDECEAIMCAPYGTQEGTLNAAGLKIGSLIAGGELEEGAATSALLSAARGMSSQPGRPAWGASELDQKTRRALRDGMATPRAASPRIDVLDEDAASGARLVAGMMAKAARARPVPDDIMAIDGALKMFVNHCEHTAISPQPFLALAAGICCIGALAGRRYRTSTDLRSNIYAVGIADSGGGKDHARKQIKKILGAAGLNSYLGGEDIASGAGMLAALTRHPSILFQIDEFGDWLAAVLGTKAAPHKRQIAEKFKSLYSSADTWIAGTEYAGQNHKQGEPRTDIQQPNACLYGTTTPAQFWAAIAGGSMFDGLLARMLVFVSPVSYPDEQDGQFIEPPDALVDAFKAIAAGVPGGGNLGGIMSALLKPEPYRVPSTPAAETAIKSLRKEQLALARSAEGTYVTSIAARWAENATKLALVRAVSRDPLAPTIEVGDVSWGRALVRHCMDSLLQDAERHVAENDFDRKCKKALEIIRKYGPVTESKMQNRYNWRHTPRDRSEVLRDLVARGLVVALAPEAATSGPKSIKYLIAPTAGLE